MAKGQMRPNKEAKKPKKDAAAKAAKPASGSMFVAPAPSVAKGKKPR